MPEYDEICYWGIIVDDGKGISPSYQVLDGEELISWISSIQHSYAG